MSIRAAGAPCMWLVTARPCYDSRMQDEADRAFLAGARREVQDRFAGELARA
jgi:hypothetical protein